MTERAGLEPLTADVDTLAAVLERRAADAPSALAFATSTRELTYGQLAAEAEGVAGGLAALGVRPGDRVALLLAGGALDFVIAFFALQRLGAAPCAFDPGTPAPLALRRAARLRPALVLCSRSVAPDLAAEAPAHGLSVVSFESVARQAPPARPPMGGGDLAFLQPTSGTSGEPRAVLTSQRNALASLRAARTMLAAGARDTLVSWVPPWHDLGLLRFVLAPVFFGAPCHLVEPAVRTLPEWLRTASRVRATILGAPDFAYRLAARLVDPRGIDLSALRVATNGGEAVRSSSILAFEERFGAPGTVRPGYGLAEATLGVACVRPGEPLRVDDRGNVSCGPPLPGVELAIQGGLRDQESPRGETIRAAGQILVRGETVFEGYFDAPEATREALRGGWLHTGDSGYLDGDGHLTVLGRERAMLKRGGEAVAPRELEEAAESVPEVRAAAAVGLPPGPQRATESTLLAIEADRAVDPAVAAAAAADAVRAALGFAPDQVLVLAARTLPRTPNGKVRHRELRDGILDGSFARRGAIVFSAGARP